MKLLTRKALEELLAARLADTQLIAPVEIDGRAYFQVLGGDDALERLVWPPAGEQAGEAGSPASPLTVNPLKEFFFPRRQELYSQRPEAITVADSAPGGPRLVLFARACETRALTILDRVFLGEVRDGSYGALREGTTVVGLQCLYPDERCFCASVGGGPFATEGMDLSLTALEDGRFAAVAVTAKGEALLSGAAGGAEAAGGAGAIGGGGQAPPAKGETIAAAEQDPLAALRKRAEAAVSRTMSLPEPRGMDGRFDSEYWREVSQSCLMCGICSYLCPTCHCFDIVDEGYLRVRCWDTCSAATFTRTAAGENHHRFKHTRYRQRVFHKFSWFKEHHGMVSCVGCGRCTRHCPVKIDIVEVVNGIGADPA